MIYVPSNNIEAKDQLGLAAGVEGWFTLKAIRKSGRVVRERNFRASASFKNLILNNGMDLLFRETNRNTYYYCRVGTGTTPPSVTDTQLVADIGQVGGNAASNISAGSAPFYFGSMVNSWVSEIGELGNVNITEVGVNGSAGNENMFSRALVLDASGDPVAFPITDEEQLQVTYELRLYPPLDDSIHQIQIGSTTHDVTVRAANVNTNQWAPSGTSSNSPNFQMVTTNASFNSVFSGDIGNIFSTPSGTSFANSARGNYSYTNGAYHRDAWASWAPGTANQANRSSTFRCSSGHFQMEFDPPILKNSDQVLRLEYRISAERHTP